MKKWIYIIGGVLFGVLLTYFIMKQFQTENSTNESHVIAYEIQKLNKLIVAEQMFSDVYSHKSSRSLPGLSDYFSFDKKVILLVNAKVQAIYDMKKLEVEVDSADKIIHINKVPPVEIQIYPDVQFYDLEQSRFNSFEKDELNSIKDRAIQHIEKTIDKPKLEREAHAQLIENLGEIYRVAKVYNWKIEDNTPYAKELDLKFN
ncbi:DUF4230 domain-containing protein [Moheibacter sediminis]|uniref:DUF4230 domain-containing protein n=1 Tax=Moheibacter sediminis TaxID=1434700 RepID=A0A1W2AN60_9FLAO|nr:DUF4230 domain-containing protein [Moheibacter sediminis]SMC61668.1 Protein of unknown function [Moheibacter sediminis]